MSAPICSSAISVWSRVRTFSITSVSPSANSPARRTADFTCALATGIFNSGANVGALLAPAVVPWIAYRWGWQAAFVAAGIAGTFGALINKNAPVQGGALIKIMGETK